MTGAELGQNHVTLNAYDATIVLHSFVLAHDLLISSLEGRRSSLSLVDL
ncbi:hypothetical protein H6F51_00020 [Cyanobacteria bacterium FACHB-DQ100]|nr:hypothetical protein [Cyanobacteria bacterium FACHB-DQ100]